MEHFTNLPKRSALSKLSAFNHWWQVTSLQTSVETTPVPLQGLHLWHCKQFFHCPQSKIHWSHRLLQSQVLMAPYGSMSIWNGVAYHVHCIKQPSITLYNLRWSSTQSFLHQMCIALKAMVLKTPQVCCVYSHMKLAQGWALIWINFTGNWAKSRG